MQLPEEIDLLPKKLRNDARSLFLLKKSNNLLENKEIQVGRKVKGGLHGEGGGKETLTFN